MGNTITSTISLPAISYGSEAGGTVICTAGNGVTNVSDAQVLYIGGKPRFLFISLECGIINLLDKVSLLGFLTSKK